MRLVIVSNMAHYRRADGVIVGHGATARELDVLASLFDEVRHVACLHDEPAPASARPYDATNVTLVPVPPAGGDALLAKLGIAARTPQYLATIARELREADAVHVRCPANISLYAVMALAARASPRRRWIKYAGAWRPVGPEPRSYTLQRRLLASSVHRSQVSINGRWPDQPAHVHTLANPSLTDAELARGQEAARAKHLASPIRLVFVGHLAAWKGAPVTVEAVAALRARGLDVRCDIVGDGRELAGMRADVLVRGLQDVVVLHGALPRAAIDELYAAAHFVVLPSRTEGWPKVLGEGMAFGAVPIASAVGSIPEGLAAAGAGVALAPSAAGIADAVAAYLADPSRWARERDHAVAAATTFSYTRYLASVRRLLDL